jgi:hypothetical protein
LPVSTPAYVSTKAAAARLGVSRRNLTRWADRILPGLVRFGPQRLLTEEDVAKLGEVMGLAQVRRRRAAAERRAAGSRRRRVTDAEVRAMLDMMGCGKLLNPDPE